ncbi:enoyl-CoA hydratase/isomerase family protein [Yinghuangia sp. ASG 101]|uniref:enoyl-CoA hydratase/isomerase family protein n=1 Tax=Yinghuangia sp. ASG 101 TaxID=2896848 RepID=UPI001E2DFE15|nr:enoyl-CoA hydratase/isomerase family protein [Yinghuangia sp. ASG 101]UGQ09288.1 enoyl-CoA hydratase/isomerase family protein [Yinghuangia sp. ASG 101]
MRKFETLGYEEADGIAWVTLNRPDRLNAFDLEMMDELHGLWRELREDDGVRVIVLTGAGDKAFCTGIDRAVTVPQPKSPYMPVDPMPKIGPKTAELWKPLIVAVNGIACGGAFYLLGECEFVIAADHATFFDPHTTYGMVSGFESTHLAQRMPFGEVMRLTLLGNAERMSARRAYETGLVSQVVPADRLHETARWAAEVIASYPPHSVQGSLRALWAARDLTRVQALTIAPHLITMGNIPGDDQEALFARRTKEFRVR